MLIFDPKWLMEKDRAEDFRFGLEQVSTQVYVKSISGYRRPSWNGHCCWNRTNGALILPDPDGIREEAVYLSTVSDDRLYSPMQGLVWNFPAAKRGLMALEDGLTLSLTDRWFNPADPHAAALSAFTFKADADLCGTSVWADVTLRWNESSCEVTVNGQTIAHLPPQYDAPNGLCYLLVQTPAEYTGHKGAYLKSLSMKAD